MIKLYQVFFIYETKNEVFCPVLYLVTELIALKTVIALFILGGQEGNQDQFAHPKVKLFKTVRYS